METKELRRGEISGERTIDVLGYSAQIGMPAGWVARDAAELARVPSNEPGSCLCAVLYRADADPSMAYSLQVWTVGEVEREPDPALWLLNVEQETGMRAVGRAACARLGDLPAYLWHMAGTMTGAALGRPHEGMVEVRSSELRCPLVNGTIQMLLIVPPERLREGQAAFSTLAATWRWLPA